MIIRLSIRKSSCSRFKERTNKSRFGRNRSYWNIWKATIKKGSMAQYWFNTGNWRTK